MFKADSENPFHGPHQGQPNSTAGSELKNADAAVILIHGRGATAESILMLADELGEPDTFYIAPQAARNTWYPYSFLMPAEKNQPGLNSGLQVIQDLVSGLEKEGVSREKIILSGFSQGGCLASEFAARHPDRYGGLVALSGGLIGDEVIKSSYSGQTDGMPVFLGCSDIDPHIPKERVDETETVFNALGADVTKKIYPGMGHTVNRDELEHFKEIIQKVRLR